MSLLNSTISFLEQPNILKVFKALFALSLGYFAFILFHYHYYLITFPYPIIYREGAMMASTAKLLHGINPYNFLLEPQYTNGYGLVYPLAVLPFASLLGVSLVVHRALTGFFILSSCAIIFFVLSRKKTPVLLNLWATLTLYASLLFPLTSTPCVDPAATGLFFMLLTIFIPFFLNYSYLSLGVSIICGFLAFYTKTYFLLGMPVMASYLFLFISKKKSIFYGFCCLAFFSFSVFVTDHFFPSYFDDCFFINYNISDRFGWTFVLIRQLHRYADLHVGIIILLSLVFIYTLVRLIMSASIKSVKNILKGSLNSIQWKNWNGPLITSQLPLDIYAGICFAAVLLISMGKHFGANLWYFFQLFSPFLASFVAWGTGRFKLWPIFFSFLLIYNLFILTRDDNYKYFDKNVAGWHEVEMLIKSKAIIFNSSLIAPLLIQENKEIYDDGTDFYAEGSKRSGFLGRFFHEDNRVNMAQSLYFNKVHSMIEYKKFDLIMIEAGYPGDVIPKNVSNYYKYIGSILVNVPQDRRPYLMTVWRPN